MKLHPPQSPLSISWLGEAKTAWKSAVSSQSEAQPGSGCSALPEAAQSGSSKKPGARAVTQLTKSYENQKNGGEAIVKGKVVKVEWNNKCWEEVKVNVLCTRENTAIRR